MASILLVEDASDICKMVEVLLRSEGHTVICVNNGIRAVQRAEHEQPDLIIMDLCLPQLDGWEATRQIKEQAGTHYIPVVAFTAHVLPDEIKSALDAGCAAIITKPFDFSIFLETINYLLDGTKERSVGS
jgi:CheY-like chemotaxis protein